jgi:hypothetical protein
MHKQISKKRDGKERKGRVNKIEIIKAKPQSSEPLFSLSLTITMTSSTQINFLPNIKNSS